MAQRLQRQPRLGKVGAAFPEPYKFSCVTPQGRPTQIGVFVLVARNYQPSNLLRALPESARLPVLPVEISKSESWHKRPTAVDVVWPAVQPEFGAAGPQPRREPVPTEGIPELNHLLYLFACQVEWEQCADPTSAWEVISAARGMHPELRAHARSLLDRPQQTPPPSPEEEEIPAEVAEELES